MENPDHRFGQPRLSRILAVQVRDRLLNAQLQSLGVKSSLFQEGLSELNVLVDALRAQRVPDLTRTLDRMKAARAVEVATLIAGARPHAMAGAFSGFLSDVDEEVLRVAIGRLSMECCGERPR